MDMTYFQSTMEAYDELQSELETIVGLESLAASVSNAKEFFKRSRTPMDVAFALKSLNDNLSVVGMKSTDVDFMDMDLDDVATAQLEQSMESFVNKVLEGISKTTHRIASSTREFFERDVKAMGEISARASRLQQILNGVDSSADVDRMTINNGTIVALGGNRLDMKRTIKAYENLKSLQKNMDTKYPDIVGEFLEEFTNIALKAADLFRAHGKNYVGEVATVVRYFAKVGMILGLFWSFLFIPFLGLLALILAPFAALEGAIVWGLLGLLLGVPTAGAIKLIRGYDATDLSEFADLVQLGQKNYKNFTDKVNKLFDTPQPGAAMLVITEKVVDLEYSVRSGAITVDVPSVKDLKELAKTVDEIAGDYVSKTTVSRRLKNAKNAIEKEANNRDIGMKALGSDFRNMLAGTGFDKDVGGKVDTSKMQVSVKRHTLLACKEALDLIETAIKQYR